MIFYIGIMFPANPLYFLQQIDLLFPEHLGGFPVFPDSIILHFLFGEFSFPVFPVLISLFLYHFLSGI